jgi:hypothetical protein
MSSFALVFKTELERFRITCIFNIVKRVLQLQLQIQYQVYKAVVAASGRIVMVIYCKD